MKKKKTRSSKFYKNPIIVDGENPFEELKIPDHKFFNFLKNLQFTVEYGDMKGNILHFNNPTENLATRCDVVYKTLLRDCRKYYCDIFMVNINRKYKKMPDVIKNINEYCSK